MDSIFPVDLLLLLLLCLIPCRLSCIPSEGNSLLSFLSNLSSTDPPQGASFPPWDAGGDPDCCRWDGVACDNLGSVTHLWLPLRGLKGPVSTAALRGLPSLTHLNLSRNSLTGVLDPSLFWETGLIVLDVSFNRLDGQLVLTDRKLVWPTERKAPLRLQTLDLSSNRFIGPLFPSEWWANAPNLVTLNASRNSFTGSIPSSVCAAHRLQALDISFNKLEGSIPSGFGNCSELTLLRIGNNNITGQVPADLYNAVSLQELSAQSNMIFGNLDTHGRIANLAKLSLLDFSYNQLIGLVPDGIGKLEFLEVLMLNNNQLNGSLPSTLSNCTKLRFLILRDNRLTGDLSSVDFSNFSELHTVDLGFNNFTGTLPHTIYSCKSLVALRLAQNNLIGRIQPELRGLHVLSFISLSKNNIVDIDSALKILQEIKNLTVVFLDGNFYGESMPEGITGFENLQILSLAGSKLKGQVPDWLSPLSNIAVLFLSDNQLTGTVPGWLGSLPNLFSLDLSDNLLSGEFPIQLTALPAFRTEQAGAKSNQSLLELPLFINFYNQPGLQYNELYNLPPSLHLERNNLTGAIPREIGRLKMVRELNLSHNSFSGSIPSEMSNLSYLEILDLSYNRLQGEIPGSLTKLNFLSKFDVAHNELWGPVPQGGQLSTFDFSSFDGNSGLCAKNMAPLPPCTVLEPEPEHSADQSVINKEFLVGFTFGICCGVASVPLILFMLHSRQTRWVCCRDGTWP